MNQRAITPDSVKRNYLSKLKGRAKRYTRFCRIVANRKVRYFKRKCISALNSNKPFLKAFAKPIRHLMGLSERVSFSIQEVQTFYNSVVPQLRFVVGVSKSLVTQPLGPFTWYERTIPMEGEPGYNVFQSHPFSQVWEKLIDINEGLAKGFRKIKLVNLIDIFKDMYENHSVWDINRNVIKLCELYDIDLFSDTYSCLMILWEYIKEKAFTPGMCKMMELFGLQQAPRPDDNVAQSDIGIAPIVLTFCCLIGAITLPAFDFSTRFNEFVSAGSKSAMSWSSLATSYDKMRGAIDNVLKYFGVGVDKTHTNRVRQTIEDVVQANKDLEDALNELKHEPAKYLLNRDKYAGLLETANHLKNQWVGIADDAYAKSRSYISKELSAKRSELKSYMLAIEKSNNGKQVPVVVYLTGGAGVGKSYFANYLHSTIAARFKKPYKAIVKNPQDGGYWNGYNGQFTVIMDDFGQHSDSTDVDELIKMYTPTSYPLNMASVEDKGRQFCSELVIICSNAPAPDLSKLLEKDAFYRRRDFFYTVTRRGDLKQDYSHLGFYETKKYPSASDGSFRIASARTSTDVVVDMVFEKIKERREEYSERMRKHPPIMEYRNDSLQANLKGVLLLGESGTGKTTTAKILCNDHYDDVALSKERFDAFIEGVWKHHEDGEFFVATANTATWNQRILELDIDKATALSRRLDVFNFKRKRTWLGAVVDMDGNDKSVYSYRGKNISYNEMLITIRSRVPEDVPITTHSGLLSLSYDTPFRAEFDFDVDFRSIRYSTLRSLSDEFTHAIFFQIVKAASVVTNGTLNEYLVAINNASIPFQSEDCYRLKFRDGLFAAVSIHGKLFIAPLNTAKYVRVVDDYYRVLNGAMTKLNTTEANMLRAVRGIPIVVIEESEEEEFFYDAQEPIDTSVTEVLSQFFYNLLTLTAIFKPTASKRPYPFSQESAYEPMRIKKKHNFSLAGDVLGMRGEFAEGYNNEQPVFRNVDHIPEGPVVPETWNDATEDEEPAQVYPRGEMPRRGGKRSKGKADVDLNWRRPLHIDQYLRDRDANFETPADDDDDDQEYVHVGGKRGRKAKARTHSRYFRECLVTNNPLPDAKGRTFEQHYRHLKKLGHPNVEPEALMRGAIVRWPAKIEVRPDFEALNILRDVIVDMQDTPQLEACIDPGCRAIASVAQKNTIDVGPVKALMLKGNIGVTVAHVFNNQFLSSKLADLKLTAPIRGGTHLKPLYQPPGVDLAYFELVGCKESFKDITNHIPKLQDVIPKNSRGILVLQDIIPFFVPITYVAKTQNVVGTHTFDGATYVPNIMQPDTNVMLTIAGDCGSPAIVMNPTVRRKILFLHNAANYREGKGSFLIYEDYLKAIGDVKGESKVQSNEPFFEPTEVKSVGAIDLVGNIVKPDGGIYKHYVQSTTRFTPSPLATAYTDTVFEPAVMSGNDERSEAESAYDFALDRMNKEVHTIPRDDAVRHAMTRIGEYCGYVMRQRGMKTSYMPMSRAINSHHSFASVSPINIQAGSSYPWVMDPRVSGKTPMLTFNGEKYVISDHILGRMLAKSVCALEKSLRAGELQKAFYNLILKDELRKVSKITSGATRLICAAPIEQVIVWRMYHNSLISCLIDIRDATPIQVGINPHSVEWDMLARKMTVFGNYVMELDAQGWDTTIPRWLANKVGYFWNGIARYTDDKYNDDDARVRILIQEMTSNYYGVLPSGRVIYNKKGTQPSGEPSTATNNSIMNWCVNYMVDNIYAGGSLEDMAKGIFVLSVLEHFKKFFHVNYGDDILKTMENYAKDYLAKFAQLAKEIFGIVYTMGDKTLNWERKHILEATFLQRNFVPTEFNIYTGGLCVASFDKMSSHVKIKPHVYRRGEALPIPPEVLSTQANGLLTEAVLRGRLFYEGMVAHVSAILTHERIECPDFPDYRSKLRSVVNGNNTINNY